jgi:hypothetical protein
LQFSCAVERLPRLLKKSKTPQDARTRRGAENGVGRKDRDVTSDVSNHIADRILELKKRR